MHEYFRLMCSVDVLSVLSVYLLLLWGLMLQIKFVNLLVRTWSSVKKIHDPFGSRSLNTSCYLEAKCNSLPVSVSLQWNYEQERQFSVKMWKTLLPLWTFRQKLTDTRLRSSWRGVAAAWVSIGVVKSLSPFHLTTPPLAHNRKSMSTLCLWRFGSSVV